MNTQPDALRFANELICAATELRVLFQVNTEMRAELRRLQEELKKANEQAEHFERLWYLRGDLNQKLVEALQNLCKAADNGHVADYSNLWDEARTAITKATGESNMTEPKPCPMCNSPVKVEATGASEFYGKTWQTVYIECSTLNDSNCCMRISLKCDADYITNAETALIECWNKLSRESE